MLSKACEYAIRASIIVAAESSTNKRLSLNEIAEKIDSPVAFTAKILQKLVRNNVLQSVKGPGGGFEVDPLELNNISLMKIAISIDGNSIFRACSIGLNECSEDNPCPVHHKYKPIKCSLIDMFENTNLQELVKGYKTGMTFLRIPDLG